MVLSMDRWRGKVAVVTGASSGIGAAIAEKLATQGLQVVGLSRRCKLSKKLSFKSSANPGKLFALKTDITKENEILEAFKWILENLGPIHVLVNNAGIREQTTLLDGDTELWKKVWDTNVLSLCISTREAVRIMKEHDIDGHIIHINSMCGHKVPGSVNMNLYPASKFAVTALTETLRQELNGLGSKIKISSVSPGGVNTEIVDRFVLSPEVAERRKMAARLEPEDVADGVLYVLSTPPHVQVHELMIKPIGELG